ncbi:LysR family transcriptional regulator [Rhodobacteraceae bacterium F11138]|nr:LysR family transcriptional regulator [Rhodobacteraceae bacterium F11138]
MNTPRRLFPSISSLRALEALDRLGSASAAADELALTQSAISRQIQTMERQMGIVLTRRDGKRLGLTPAARSYAAEMRKVLNQIAQASLRLQVAPLGGTLNLAILPTFGMRWLVPRLPAFSRQHPDVTVNMATRLKPFNFEMEGFDAAVHFGDSNWPDTDSLLLRHEQVIPVCSPELIPHGQPVRPVDIRKMPLLHIQTRPTAWRAWFAAQGVLDTSPLPGTLYDQFSTITQAALHGLGVALMPDYLIERDLAQGRLVALHGRATETEGAYYLVWPHSKSHDPALQTFRDWLATQAQPEDPLPR